MARRRIWSVVCSGYSGPPCWCPSERSAARAGCMVATSTMATTGTVTTITTVTGMGTGTTATEVGQVAR